MVYLADYHKDNNTYYAESESSDTFMSSLCFCFGALAQDFVIYSADKCCGEKKSWTRDLIVYPLVVLLGVVMGWGLWLWTVAFLFAMVFPFFLCCSGISLVAISIFLLVPPGVVMLVSMFSPAGGLVVNIVFMVLLSRHAWVFAAAYPKEKKRH